MMQKFASRFQLVVGLDRGFTLLPFSRAADDWGLYVSRLRNEFGTPLAARGTEQELTGLLKELKS